MKILKITLLVLVSLVAILLAVAAFLPSTYHIERKIVINAPLEVVYENIISLENWKNWDPWMAMEPDAKNTYTGTRGIGQKHEWDGKLLGKGQLTIVDAVELETMNFELEFITPFASKATGGFVINRVADGIETVWFMDGNLDYPLGRFMGLTMDSQMGPDFEKGLQKMKELCEKLAAETPEIFSSELSEQDDSEE